eukprot:scaffold6.g2806.t1
MAGEVEQPEANGVHWEEQGKEVPGQELRQLPGADEVEAPPSSPLPQLALKALVVGGSISGCCTALALRELGVEVHVYERSGEELPCQGAGLNIQPDMGEFLMHFGVCRSLEDLCVRSSGRQYVDHLGKVVAREDKAQYFCGWDVLFRALRARVEGVTYHQGSAVTGVDLRADGVSLALEDGSTAEGDLLVGADGAGSIVRTLLSPDTKSTFARYVAWRGFLAESAAPRSVVEFLNDRFTLFQGFNFHILAHLTTGPNGEREPGKRRINWVWYWNTPEGELDRILTDCHGVRHDYSIPRGLLARDVSAVRKRIAQEVLPEQLAALVVATRDIFVQTVQDLLAPTFVFGGRACLVGDSGCILRPHTAAGTTKGAINAWVLNHALAAKRGDLAAALQDYDERMRPLATYLLGMSQRIGRKSQFPQGSPKAAAGS